MLYGLYHSAGGIASARATQDVIANNLANADTVGFKRLVTLDAERPAAHSAHSAQAVPADPRFARVTGGPLLHGTALDRGQGGVEHTGNPLDLALVGDGFLTVSKDGQARLTRDGRLNLDAAGRLVLDADPSALVLDVEGEPITLPADVARDSFQFDDAGTLKDAESGKPYARLDLGLPRQPDTLRPVGGSLFDFAGGTTSADGGVVVRQGYVEQSNVDPTVELTRMIEVGRLLEANANLIKYADTSLGKLIDAAAIS